MPPIGTLEIIHAEDHGVQIEIDTKTDHHVTSPGCVLEQIISSHSQQNAQHIIAESKPFSLRPV